VFLCFVYGGKYYDGGMYYDEPYCDFSGKNFVKITTDYDKIINDYYTFRLIKRIYQLVNKTADELKLKYGGLDVAQNIGEIRHPDPSTFNGQTEHGFMLMEDQRLFTPWGQLYIHYDGVYKWNSIIFQHHFFKNFDLEYVGQVRLYDYESRGYDVEYSFINFTCLDNGDFKDKSRKGSKCLTKISKDEERRLIGKRAFVTSNYHYSLYRITLIENTAMTYTEPLHRNEYRSNEKIKTSWRILNCIYELIEEGRIDEIPESFKRLYRIGKKYCRCEPGWEL
jgi:hypothetical protein